MASCVACGEVGHLHEQCAVFQALTRHQQARTPRGLCSQSCSTRAQGSLFLQSTSTHSLLTKEKPGTRSLRASCKAVPRRRTSGGSLQGCPGQRGAEAGGACLTSQA